MKTLNLAYLEKSDIKYEKIKYPDGQQDLILNLSDVSEGTQVRILTRLTSFLDVEILLCALDIVESNSIPYEVEIVYLLGARSDRRFKDNGTSYIEKVLLPLLPLFQEFHFLDPHCELQGWYTSQLPTDLFENVKSELSLENTVLVYPDKGSVKRVDSIIENTLFLDKVYCQKERNTEGKLVNTTIPVDDFNGKDILIIDDIGDGFGTFINIAKELKNRNVGKTYLMVTHTIQEVGALRALEYFDEIFTTNSYADFNIDRLNITEVI